MTSCTNLSCFINDDKRNVDDDCIKKLQNFFDEGADVIFRDAKLDNNSPLHLAVMKRDVKTVEFLMTLSPDLSIKNNSNETAKALVEKMNFRDILKLFANRKKIEKSDKKFFIEVLKCGNLEIALESYKATSENFE
jgi:ankyrin repeat protein